MDLTTLAAAVLVALGLLGVNAVMNANSVIVDVTVPAKMERFNIDQATVEQEFDAQLFTIAKTSSMVVPVEIHASRDQGIGMALAKEAKLENVAYALETEMGIHPDRLRLSLFTEDGSVRAVVNGSSKRVGDFRQVLIMQKDETLLQFVNRCAIWSASQIAPYITALYLIQHHAGDKDFADAIALIEQAKDRLPSTPISLDRSAFDNLLGIIALFNNDPKGAGVLFDRAMAEDPDDVAATLNAAFASIQLDNYHKAAELMEGLVEHAPPSNSILLASGYMTWAAAEMGERDLEHANALLEKSLQINPDSSTAIDLLADLKEAKGDKAAAAELHRKAQQSEETFENYGEIAALYFRLAWQDNQPVTRSKFNNPKVVTFH